MGTARCSVFGDIGDCGVGITQQMCNTVTNHWDMGIFSRHALKLSNSVLVRVPINIYFYEQMITLFVILLAETPSDITNCWCCINIGWELPLNLQLLHFNYRFVDQQMSQLFQICWSSNVGHGRSYLICNYLLHIESQVCWLIIVHGRSNLIAEISYWINMPSLFINK